MKPIYQVVSKEAVPVVEMTQYLIGTKRLPAKYLRLEKCTDQVRTSGQFQSEGKGLKTPTSKPQPELLHEMKWNLNPLVQRESPQKTLMMRLTTTKTQGLFPTEECNFVEVNRSSVDVMSILP